MRAYKTIQCGYDKLEATINDMAEKKWYFHSLSSFAEERHVVVFTNFTTSFENIDQKANQLYNNLSSVIKNLKEMRNTIDRNII